MGLAFGGHAAVGERLAAANAAAAKRHWKTLIALFDDELKSKRVSSPG